MTNFVSVPSDVKLIIIVYFCIGRKSLCITSPKSYFCIALNLIDNQYVSERPPDVPAKCHWLWAQSSRVRCSSRSPLLSPCVTQVRNEYIERALRLCVYILYFVPISQYSELHQTETKISQGELYCKCGCSVHEQRKPFLHLSCRQDYLHFGLCER